jgi:hypothetical protein
MEKYKLKKGDTVWVRLPANAKIIRVSKRDGYTLKTKDGNEWCYFGDDEVVKVKGSRDALCVTTA